MSGGGPAPIDESALQAALAAEPGWMKGLRRADRGLAIAEGAFLVIALMTLIVLGVGQAFMRNAADHNPQWIDEVIRYSVFFIGLAGAALAAQNDSMLSIDLLTRLLPPRGRVLMRIIAALFTAWVCWLFIEGSFVLRRVALTGESGDVIDPADGILALPVAAALIALHMLLHAFLDAIYLARGKLPPHTAAEVKL